VILGRAKADDVPALHDIAERAYGVYVERIGLIGTPDHVLIENVAVDHDHQRGGIGRALLSLAEDCARELGLDRLRLYTNVAMVENPRLYARLGYEEDDRHIGDRFQRVDMSRRLG
jgi:GNAT superfamily N-acetyltransferase